MEARTTSILLYRRSDHIVPFERWIADLRDIRGKQKIFARIDRVRLGNLGDHGSIGAGLLELRIHFGPGYRIYIGREKEAVVILLCAGDKSTQNEDIKQAKIYWKDYQEAKKYAGR